MFTQGIISTMTNSQLYMLTGAIVIVIIFIVSFINNLAKMPVKKFLAHLGLFILALALMLVLTLLIICIFIFYYRFTHHQF